MRSANTLVSTIPFIIINDNAPKLFHIELPLLALSGPHYADIPEEMYAVMQPFYRIEHSRNRATGGTGLGLAIAQQLVASLSGELTLTNRRHGGLRVTVTLPDTLH